MARQLLQPLTILHVEDDEGDAILFRKACERARLPVILHHAADAEQAKAYLVGESEFSDRARFPLPQVLVLDLKLPRMTGFEFLRWLRSQAGFEHLPVLIFTSSLARDDKAQAIEDGASSYFVKPASFEALVQIVGKIGLSDESRLN